MQVRNFEKLWLGQIAESFPEKEFLRQSGKSFDYSHIYKKVLGLSNQLYELGVRRNSPVGLLMKNSSEFVTCVLALWQLGAVPIPLNSLNSSVEISEQIKFSEMYILLVDDLVVEPFRTAVRIETIQFEDISESETSIREIFNLEKIALRMFTSGSSGKSKLVELSFRNLFASADSLEKFLGEREFPVWLATLPFYHIGGFMIFVRSLLSAGSIVIVENFRAGTIRSELNKTPINYFSIVSKTLRELLDDSPKFPESLKAVFAGGGPVQAELMTLANECGLNILNVYGSTVRCSMVKAHAGRESPDKLCSACKPMPGVNVQIGESDEILIRSNSLARGYYKNEFETSARFHNGLYRTGDAGKIDSSGFLYIFGRLDGAIISGGEKVHPAEVEEKILEISGIYDCCVTGITDKQWGQCVSAVISADHSPDKHAIELTLQKSLAKYKIPKRYFHCSEIPRDQLGKVNHKAVFKLIESSELKELF